MAVDKVFGLAVRYELPGRRGDSAMTNAELHALRAMAEALPEIAKQLQGINKHLAALAKTKEAKS